MQRKDLFFHIKVDKPLGIKLIEVSSEEANDLLNKIQKYLENKQDFSKFFEYEVYKGKKNYYVLNSSTNDDSLEKDIFNIVYKYLK